MTNGTITLDLGLPEFRVRGQQADDQRIEVFIEKAIPIGVCPDCHRPTDYVHDYRWDDVWDIPLRDKEVVLQVRRRRYCCQEPECSRCQSGRPFDEVYESIDPYARRTKRLDQYIYELAKEMTATALAGFLKRRHIPISDKTVERVYQALGQAELDARPIPAVLVVGIDEFSIRKGHRYATIINDLIHCRPLDLFPKRDKDTVCAHLRQLPCREVIRAVVIDMSKPFRAAVVETLPEAKIVIDKFHVIKAVIAGLDEVHKRVQRQKAKGEKKPIYRLRYLLRKGQEKLTEEDCARLAEVLDREPELHLAYELKEQLRTWYDSKDLTTARQGLKKWYRQVEESGLEEMQEVAATIRRWEEEILNYFLWRFTNGFTEGQNNKIKTLKRRGYHYRNFEHFWTRVLLAAA